MHVKDGIPKVDMVDGDFVFGGKTYAILFLSLILSMPLKRKEKHQH